MGTRIRTLQAQVRELGRLRAGLSVPKTGGGLRPDKSRTWIITSPWGEYLEPAAQLWGGQVEKWQPLGNGGAQYRVITEAASIDAILPPGDPISQAYELWSGGGCARRCDGETEALKQKPCPCRAQFGEEFYLQKVGTVCKPTTRLSLILPELPALGIWRVETHGWYNARELPAIVDLIKDQIGHGAMVPVALRIEPRTRIADGKTKQFIAIALDVRGTSARQILAGQVPTLELGGVPERRALGAGPATSATPALEAAPAPAAQRAARPVEPQADPEPETDQRWQAAINACRTPRQCDVLAADMQAAGAGPDLIEALQKKRASFFAPARDPEPVPDGPGPDLDEPDDVVDVAVGEPEPDRTAVWNELLALAGSKGWNRPSLAKRFHERMGLDYQDADGWKLAEFRDLVRTGVVK